MKKWIILFPLLLSSCGMDNIHPDIQPVSVAGVQKPVAAAVVATADAVVAAKVVEAQGTPAHSLLSLSLLEDTNKIKADLDSATTQLALMQSKLDAQAAEQNKMAERLNYLEPKYAESVALIWKWRLIAIGEAVAVVAFFVARQYLPFLKIF